MDPTETNLRGYALAHPVYLDVPMMLNFLAHLEGGFSASESEQQTTSGAHERFRRAKANLLVKLPGAGQGALGGEAGKQVRDETRTVIQTERHHTEASLFNLLYAYLDTEKQVLKVNDSADLSNLYSGQLVEVSGEHLGNPIEDILNFFDSFYSYVVNEGHEKGGAAKEKTPAELRRSGHPASRAAAKKIAPKAAQESLEEEQSGIRVLTQMARDMKSAPVHDLLFRTEHGVDAVVTAASEYYTTTTTEHLRAGEFRVMGKVTKVLKEDDGNGHTINLTRRTVVGAAGPDVAQEMISSIDTTDGLNLRVAEPIVKAPAVQILPMAIFI